MEFDAVVILEIELFDQFCLKIIFIPTDGFSYVILLRLKLMITTVLLLKQRVLH